MRELPLQFWQHPKGQKNTRSWGALTRVLHTFADPGFRSISSALANLPAQVVTSQLQSFCKFLASVFPPAAPQVSKEESVESQMGKAVGKSDVWFRFNEGVSNAVRRNIYIRDLL